VCVVFLIQRVLLCLHSSPGTLAKVKISSSPLWWRYQMTHFNLTQKGTSKISGRGSKRVGGWWVERDSVAALVFSFTLVCARGPHFFCSALRLLQLLSLCVSIQREEAKLPALLLFHHHQYYLHRRAPSFRTFASLLRKGIRFGCHQ
jgi:hypothetical protein